MKNRINILFFCLLLFTISPLLAQPDSAGVNVLQDSRVSGSDQYPLQPGIKPGWNVSVGSNFMYSPGFGSLSGFSVTPVYTMPLSPRLSLHGGASVTQFYSPGRLAVPEQGIRTQAGVVSLFGSASYRLSDHLILYGTGVKNLGKPPLLTPYSPYMSDSFTLGSVLQLGEHFSIGASLRMSNDPYGNLNPFNRYNQFNPFNTSPFPFTP